MEELIPVNPVIENQVMFAALPFAAAQDLFEFFLKSSQIDPSFSLHKRPLRGAEHELRLWIFSSEFVN